MDKRKKLLVDFMHILCDCTYQVMVERAGTQVIAHSHHRRRSLCRRQGRVR